MSFSGKYHNQLRGFTLLEMIVVIAIFTFMTGIILMNLPDFRDRTSLELLAQQMAINIRTAQVYAIGTKVSSTAGAERYNWYGVHFNDTQPSKFFLFADNDKSGKYEPGSGVQADTIEAEYKLIGGYGILHVKGITGSGADTLPISDIVYRRPNPESQFCAGTNNGCKNNPDSYNQFEITIGRLANPTRTKTIIVSANGQINVATTP